MAVWEASVFRSPAFQRGWARSGARAWHCEQRAGELVYIPRQLRHATLNPTDTLAVAIQHDMQGCSPLHLAAHRGAATAVAELLAVGAPADARSHTGLTPLHAAAFEGHAASIRFLLESGALASAVDEDGTTPLHAACRHGGASAVAGLVDAALAHDRSLLDARDGRGATPLHAAAYEGEEAAAAALIGAGASVSQQDRQGLSALDVAHRRGHDAVVGRLLAAGAPEPLSRKLQRVVVQAFHKRV